MVELYTMVDEMGKRRFPLFDIIVTNVKMSLRKAILMNAKSLTVGLVSVAMLALHAGTWHVDANSTATLPTGSPEAPFATIQEAVDAAEATVDASYNRGKDKLKKLSDPKRRKGIHEMTEMTDYLWDPAHRVLKVWEYGGRPTFYFNDYETLAPMKEMYDAWQPMKHLVYEFIDRHDKLAEGVYRTRWANGEEVVVNYSDDKPYDYCGRTVAPLGYEFYQKGTN